jgi:hypothetical protein
MADVPRGLKETNCVKQNNLPAVYEFGRIMNAKRFTALHLLPCLCDMDPVELVWNLVKLMKMTEMGHDNDADRADEENAASSTNVTNTEPSVYRLKIQINAH